MSPVQPATYHLTRLVILRLLGLVYLVAFLIVIDQGPALIGEQGLLPTQVWLDRLVAHFGDAGSAQGRYPTLFLWTGMSDGLLLALGWTGALLSAAVLLGLSNGLVLLLLWAIYLSITNVGQLFWGYGWENQLLETGFLAVFLCPLLRMGPLTPGSPPPPLVIGLFRWLIFRIMLGAGLIKLRGDACWTDLTCLMFHYETQPIPHPLSWFLHHLPVAVHKAGVLFNHFAELVVPFAAFGPRRVRHIAGGILVLFQITLIASGNLSFLNWLTLIPCLACFDDSLLARLIPGRAGALVRHRLTTLPTEPTPGARAGAIGLAALVAMLSYGPVTNLLSERQAMNTSFDPLNLVNTYGAFGSVGRERNEIVLMGTLDASPSQRSHWVEYAFVCKPGDPAATPCLVTPYHHRLDWQIWFAAFQRPGRNPWLAHLAYKLLIGDEAAISLLRGDPFEGRGPPRWIKAELFRYEFTEPGAPGWWTRRHVGRYLPPVSLDSEPLLSLVEELTVSP